MDKKPLGGKAYGSIPHLPGSRVGPADHKCHEGQAKIATVKVRDKHDTIVVQEKLDGSNVCVAKIDGKCVALTRRGYLATTSPFEMHHIFDKWVNEHYSRFDVCISEGERICGEWLYQAHGTIYDLPHEPFVVFDIMRGHERLTYKDLRRRISGFFISPALIHSGDSMSIETAMEILGSHGWHGAVDDAEGAVWRVERDGKVDFLVKYVHPYKVDGRYLPEMSGKEPVYNQFITIY